MNSQQIDEQLDLFEVRTDLRDGEVVRCLPSAFHGRAGVEKTVLGDAGDPAVRELWLFGLQRLWLLHGVNIGRFHADPGDDRHDHCGNPTVRVSLFWAVGAWCFFLGLFIRWFSFGYVVLSFWFAYLSVFLWLCCVFFLVCLSVGIPLVCLCGVFFLVCLSVGFLLVWFCSEYGALGQSMMISRRGLESIDETSYVAPWPACHSEHFSMYALEIPMCVPL